VTAFPDVTVHELTDDDEFLVIACDGRLADYKMLPQPYFSKPSNTNTSDLQVSGIARLLKPSSSLFEEELPPSRNCRKFVRI